MSAPDTRRAETSAPAGPFRLGYRPALDGVRALAIVAVMAFHTSLRGTSGGFLGVVVFFVLSGFLITSLLLEELDRTQRVRLRAFYRRRALRLYPALVVMLIVTTSVALVASPDHARHTALNGFIALTYVANWVIALTHWKLDFLGHTWSLAIEEQFYLLWPIALIGLTRAGKRWAIGTTAGVIVVSAAWRTLLYRPDGAGVRRVNFGFDTRLDSLMIGCLVALLLGYGYLAPHASKRRGAQIVNWLAVVALAVTILGWTARLVPALLTVGYTVFGVLCAIVILALVRSPGTTLERGLSHPVLVWIGKRSYGLYLWHLPIFTVFDRWSHRPPLPARLAVELVVTFAVAEASYRWVETPFLRRKRRVADEAVTASEAAASRPSDPVVAV
ncbi:MAG: hypothetical protein QOG03_1225 [Actinomycetota bacterium]|jgi:peptidoglycan/LPS O-acetylase OafA/YrhL|nr:hypothetical protein [Actinomycetota bacterium]